MAEFDLVDVSGIDLDNLTDEQMDALIDGYEQGLDGNPVAVQDDGETKVQVAAPGDDDSDSVEQDDQPVAKVEAEPEPEGILTRDGKHVMPYWRLVEAEDKARQAAARVAELESLVEQAKSSQGEPGKTHLDLSDLSEDELAALEEELSVVDENQPVIGKAIRVSTQSAIASRKEVEALKAQVASLLVVQEKLERDEQAKNESTVMSAIAQTPKLEHLRANDPVGFQRAVEIDKMLRDDPAWAGKPLTERFAKVSAAYEAIHGAIPAKSAAPAKDKPRTSKPNIPLSMDAIPGGTPPPINEAAALGALSATELTNKFMMMTPDQIEAALSRHNL